MEHIGSRIKAFREASGLTQTDLFRSTGIKQTTLSSVESGTEPKAGIIGAMLAAYPTLNPDWLLTGHGPMLRDGKALTAAEPAASYASPARPAERPLQIVPEAGEVVQLKERIKDKDTIIEILREQLDTLRSYLPEQLGKLVPDSVAAEPRQRVGFSPVGVTMMCDGREYTDMRYEASTIWRLQA
jgi:transcriptional regulator with XRE-family HTH domain